MRRLKKRMGQRLHGRDMWHSSGSTDEGFWLRSSSTGLFGDKKRCGMVEEDRCVLCNEGKQGGRC